MLDWHKCQICYPLEIKLLLLYYYYMTLRAAPYRLSDIPLTFML